jgi:hypothetical protein
MDCEISIGRCPILNAITLSGFWDIISQKSNFYSMLKPQP